MEEPKLVNCFECQNCNQLYHDEQDAEYCCAVANKVEAYECSECSSLFEDIEDAEECCK